VALHDEFTEIRVQHISMTESDNCAIMIWLWRQSVSVNHNRDRCFRYENVWQSHTEYDETVQRLWQENSVEGGLSGVVSTLNNMQKGLDNWGHQTFGNLKHKLT
jgi:hypothetical protein